MKYLSIVASIAAFAATAYSAAHAQGGPIQPASCTTTSTARICPPDNGVETITVYEQPFVSTSTLSFDCSGCQAVTVVTDCAPGIPITSTSFLYENAQSTTTVDVCSPTPTPY